MSPCEPRLDFVLRGDRFWQVDFDCFDAAVRQSTTLYIVTIEDPIEYLFQDDKANINQREVGIDCLSFNEALQASCGRPRHRARG